MFFLVLSYGISTTLQQTIPIHPSKGVHWSSRKRLFELSEAYSENYSENVCIFCILSSERSRVELFLGTLAGVAGIFPKSSLEQLFSREPAGTCFCKKELHSTR